MSRPGRQVDLAPRAAVGALCEGETRRPRLGPLGRHRVDPRARCARSASRSTSGRRRRCVVARRRPARPAGAGGADRLRQRGHARAAARRDPRRARTGRFELDRRRVALAAADGPDRRSRSTRDGRVDRVDRRPPAARGRGQAAARDRLRAAGRERAGEVGGPARRARRRAGRRRCSSPRRRATTPS